jgi:hypothetical protein
VPQQQPPNINIDIALIDVRPYFPEDMSGPMSVRLGSRLERVILEVIDSGNSPFKTKTDFVRTGAFYYAAWYKEQAKLQNPVLQRMLLEGKMQIRADDNRQWVVRQQETLHSIHDLLTSLVNIGALQEIYDTIREYCDMILEIQQMFWRNQYAKSFHELGSVQLAVALLSGSGLGVPLSYSQGVQGVVAGSYVGSGTNLPAQSGVPAGSGQVNGRVPHAQGPGGTDADGDRAGEEGEGSLPSNEWGRGTGIGAEGEDD